MSWGPASCVRNLFPFLHQEQGPRSIKAWFIPANPILSLQQGGGSIDSAGSRDGKSTPVRQALPGRGANRALQDLNLVNLGDLAVRIAAGRAGQGPGEIYGTPAREMGVA